MQHFRAKFDLGAEPDLYEFGQRDIYSVSSLLKQYFRQLPNPLFTFQAYSNILVWHVFIILYHQAFFRKHLMHLQRTVRVGCDMKSSSCLQNIFSQWISNNCEQLSELLAHLVIWWDIYPDFANTHRWRIWILRIWLLCGLQTCSGRIILLNRQNCMKFCCQKSDLSLNSFV